MTPFTKTIKAGMHLFRENDRSRELYLIQSGSVTVYRTVGGKEIELATLKKGAVLGEMALIDGKPRSASVKAREDCTVIIINADTFHEKTKGMPSWFISIIRSTSQKIRQANRRLQSISSDHQGAHIIMVLNLYYQRFGTETQGVRVFPLQYHLIQLLGVTNQTISTVFDFLCKHQFITLTDTALQIIDRTRLGEYCEYLRFFIRKQYDGLDPSNESLHRCTMALMIRYPDIVQREEASTIIEGEDFYHILQETNLEDSCANLIETLQASGCCNITRKRRPTDALPLGDTTFKCNHLACKRAYLFYKYQDFTPLYL